MILDDDAVLVRLMKHLLTPLNHELSFFSDLPEALIAVQSQRFDLIISDFSLPSGEALDFFRSYRKINPKVPIIVVSGFMSFEKVLEISKVGIAGIYTKPLDVKGLTQKVKDLLALIQAREENSGSGGVGAGGEEARAEEIYLAQLGNLPGRSAAHAALMDQIEKTKDFTGAIQILGPQGSEFERVVSELVQRASNGVENRLTFLAPHEFRTHRLLQALKAAYDARVMLNLGILSGHRLDDAQQLLMELLLKREGIFAPYANFYRILFCTEHDVSDITGVVQFRDHLAFSLGLMTLTIPSLEERQEDIPLICRDALDRLRKQFPDLPAQQISPIVVSWLQKRSWPGNAQELEDILETAILASPQVVVDLGVMELATGHISRK